jgi:hypothetical protein
MRRAMINALKPLVFALATALASVAAFADQSDGLPREEAQDSINVKVIDTFLADSREHLGL